MRITVLLWTLLASLTAMGTRLPWLLAGGVPERVRIADAVLAGTIVSNSALEPRTQDGVMVNPHQARFRIDRIFKGGPVSGEIRFTWYTIYHEPGKNYVGSTPPLADLRQGQRYLLFLRHSGGGWTVITPVYQEEFELAPHAPAGALADLSAALPAERDRAIAEELELAALSQAPPQPGTTGWAPIYFPPVYDLIGGCAAPFFEWFMRNGRTPSLRKAADDWMKLMRQRKPPCTSQLRFPLSATSSPRFRPSSRTTPSAARPRR